MQNRGTGSDIWRWRKRNFSSQTRAKKKKFLQNLYLKGKVRRKKKKKKRNYKISFNLITKEYVIVKWRGGGIHNYLFMFENGFLF